MTDRYELTLGDGSKISAPDTDRLAWKLAEHAAGDEWPSLPYSERCAYAKDALAELNRLNDFGIL